MTGKPKENNGKRAPKVEKASFDAVLVRLLKAAPVTREAAKKRKKH
jgi:hypothetical protein